MIIELFFIPDKELWQLFYLFLLFFRSWIFVFTFFSWLVSWNNVLGFSCFSLEIDLSLDFVSNSFRFLLMSEKHFTCSRFLLFWRFTVEDLWINLCLINYMYYFVLNWMFSLTTNFISSFFTFKCFDLKNYLKKGCWRAFSVVSLF